MSIEDFDGDYEAMLKAKVEKGFKVLTQEEKMKMFAIADRFL